MDDKRRYWFSLQAAIIVAVLTAALAGVFESVPFEIGLLRATLIIAAGLAGLSLARYYLDGDGASSSHSTATRRLSIAITGIILTASILGLVMTRGTRNPASAEESSKPIPVRDAVQELAGKLANKTWAMEGESCSTDGLQTTLDGDDLVVSPRGDMAKRYQLFGAHGQQLILRSGNQPVFLELRSDGFTLIEGENTQWFGLCS